jgi:hypothetical protein
VEGRKGASRMRLVPLPFTQALAALPRSPFVYQNCCTASTHAL